MNIKEIKERAEQRALGYNNSDVNKQDYYLGYCDGAVDQKKIDIDTAQCLCCEALCYDRDSCEIEDVECERLLMIRKAMKGIL